MKESAMFFIFMIVCVVALLFFENSRQARVERMFNKAVELAEKGVLTKEQADDMKKQLGIKEK